MMEWKTIVIKTIVCVVAAAVASAHVVSEDTYLDKVRSFKPQRFAQVRLALEDSGKGPISLRKDIPDVSVGMQCVILLTILYFFAGFMDLLLMTYERSKSIYSQFFEADEFLTPQEEEADSEMVNRFKDAQEAMVHATREVPMLAIVILFSHYRVSLDLGFSGPNLDQYPEIIEVGFYVATFIVIVEYVFVFFGMCIQLTAHTGASNVLKFGTLFMELSMFMGEFATIGAAVSILVIVVTHKPATVV